MRTFVGGFEWDVLQSASMPTCAVMSGSTLPYTLKALLQNDSLLDIGRRGQLYRGILKLVESLGAFLFPTEVERLKYARHLYKLA